VDTVLKPIANPGTDDVTVDHDVGQLRPRLGRMPTFLVESYEPRGRAHEPAELEERARAAARACGGRYVRSILTPQDELCLYLFEAPTREGLEQAAASAGLMEVRITEASELPGERGGRR
jgi:hypothetical protein